MLINENDGGGREAARGKYQIGNLSGLVRDSNISNIACNLPSTLPNPNAPEKQKVFSNLASSTPRHANIRTIFPTVAQARTQEDRDRDDMMEEVILQQEREEVASAAWIQARQDMFAAAACTKVNGPHEGPHHRRTEESNVVMEDAGSTPHPVIGRGTKNCKSSQSQSDKQLQEQECIANTATSLAASLRESAQPRKVTTFETPNSASKGAGSIVPNNTPLKATTLFQRSSLVSDLTTLCPDSAHSTSQKPPKIIPPANNSRSALSSLTADAADKGTSALHPSKYSSVSHN